MNELQMVRSLLDETPSEQVVSEGRERLQAEVRSGQRPVRRSAVRWTAGIGAVAAVAAVAMAVALSGGTTARAPDEDAAAEPLTARNALLAAAQQAETRPAAGTYWHVKVMHTLPVRVGPKGRQYWMNSLEVSESWTEPSGQTWSGQRTVGATPRTPADAAAWRRDGSPAKWDLGPGDTVDREHIFLYTTPQPGVLFKPDAFRSFVVCDKKLNFKQLQALPARATLKATLNGLMDRNDDGPVAERDRRGFAKGCLASLLVDVPATPQTRAAAFRVLADEPGVETLGKVKDERGRQGVGIVIRKSGPYPEIKLVIDPKTSVVLSQQVGKQPVFTKNVKALYLDVGWTDSAPQVPTVP